jgi:hypothetical protein
LLPGILFHVTNNALALLMANFQGHLQQTSAAESSSSMLFRLFEILFRQPSHIFSYQVPYSISVLAVCTLVATATLTWLIKQPLRSPAAVESGDGEPDATEPKSAGVHGTTGLADLAAGLSSLTTERRDATS